MGLKIGIFDSGIGGLTVAKAIKNKLPQAELVYFGDTAHLPYGDKSPASIRHYSTKITQFLLSENCTALVIACNTASAHAFKTVKDVAGPDIPVFNVIDPVVKFIATRYQNQKVGIIATRGTIKTRVYPRSIKIANSSITVGSKSTPLLASMIEEGFFNDSIPQAVLEAYFSDNRFKDIDSIILGCTHYPLVKDEVNNLLPSGVAVIDSPSIVAEQLNSVLIAMGEKVTESTLKEKHHFQVSDLTENFKFSARHFFGDDLTLEEVVL